MIEAEPRWATPLNPEARSVFGQYLSTAEVLDMVLLPWQERVLRLAAETDDDGYPFYRTIVIISPRQGGKSGTLKVAITRLGLTVTNGLVLMTQQTGSDASTTWLRYAEDLEAGPIGRRVKVHKANGKEHVTFPTGTWYSPFSIRTSGTGAHGRSLDGAFLDEAFAFTDQAVLTALRPTLIARPQAQLWIASAAGTDESVLLAFHRDLGRELVANDACRAARVAYVEYAMADDEDPYHPDTWRRNHPGIIDHHGRGLIRIEDLAAEATAMPIEDFTRAYLGRWTTGEEAAEAPPIDASVWKAAEDPLSTAVAGAPVAFAFDVSSDRRWSVVAAVGRRHDGLVHVEIVDNQPGTKWLERRLRGLHDKHHPVSIGYDPAGPGASMVAGLTGLPLVPIGGRNLAAACGLLCDDVANGAVRHRGHPELDMAVLNAERRPMGDSWVFSRRKARQGGGTDLSPLMAATIGRYAFALHEATPVPVVPDRFVF